MNMIDWAEVPISFPDSVEAGDQNLGRVERRVVSFPRRVRKATAVIGSFFAAYTDEDHPLWRFSIVPVVFPPQGNTVEFDVNVLLRDSSTDDGGINGGKPDDKYRFSVVITIFADLFDG
jgi:hypothetical protein